MILQNYSSLSEVYSDSFLKGFFKVRSYLLAIQIKLKQCYSELHLIII